MKKHCFFYYQHYNHYCKNNNNSSLYYTSIIKTAVLIICALSSMPTAIDFHQAKALESSRLPKLLETASNNNVVIAQAASNSSTPLPCKSPSPQQAIVVVYTQIEGVDHFVEVPINALSFSVFVTNNDGAKSFTNLKLSNPLSICLSPGHFTITESNFPPGIKFGEPIYSLTGTAADTYSNLSCVGNVAAGKHVTCRISNVITGPLVQNTSTNNTAIGQENNATTLRVLGTASANIKPDRITMLLGIETTNKTANDAITANSESMNKAIDTLKHMGIDENSTSTSSLEISPNYSQIGPRGNITGFTVTNFIKIQSPLTTTNDISKWIDGSIQAGINRINSVDFSLSDKKLNETKTTLLKNAINDAQRKANITSSALGMKMVGIKSIDLDVTESAIPIGSHRLVTAQAMPASTGSASATSVVVPGEQRVFQTVNITFLLHR